VSHGSQVTGHEQVLEVRGLRLKRGARVVLENVSLTLQSGQVAAIIGPNGSGKSTLLAALAGLRNLEDGAGEILLENKSIASFSKPQLSRRIAFLPASTSVPFPLTVAELIDQANPKPEARANAIRAMELESLEFVPITRLSTGEARRAWLAMTLARETPVLLLDEPLSGLDPRYQMRLLETLETRARNGASVLLVAHDLPYASRVDRVIALGNQTNNISSVLADGPPLEVLQPEFLRSLYGVNVWIGRDLETGAVFPFPTKAV
jgi:iron complex transport system ATP-binding protein